MKDYVANKYPSDRELTESDRITESAPDLAEIDWLPDTTLFQRDWDEALKIAQFLVDDRSLFERAIR